MKRILICGGSNLLHMPVFHYLCDNFDFLFPYAEEIIEGGATGADYAANVFAYSRRGMKSTQVKAEWKLYGKAAGPIRNTAMAALKPDAGLVFPGNNGTKDMSNKLLKLPIPVFFVMGDFPKAPPKVYSL